MTRVATWNAPQRAGLKPRIAGFQRLADLGATVIAAQEIPDADAPRLCPDGWRRHRPAAARSEVIYWNPRVWECLSRGRFQISSPTAPAPRYIVWVRLRHRATGHVERFGAVHLVAFKTSRNGGEYRHQAQRVAEWLGRGGHRSLLGDFNGEMPSRWLAPVDEVARRQTPAVRSGPKGQPIDLIVRKRTLPRARNARALPGFPGDHKPVIATLPLERSKP